MKDADAIPMQPDPEYAKGERELVALIASAPELPARLRRSDPMYVEALRRRIARRVTVDEYGCWVWRGYLNRKGYGNMGAFGNKGAYAHRVSLAVFYDETPIPPGHSVDHLCRNRACVNPMHLEVVLHGENVRRGNTGITWARRTHCKNGHEFTPENTGKRHDCDGRVCLTCKRETLWRARAKQKAA